MKKVHKEKVEHLVGLLLIIAFAIMLGVTPVMAQGGEDITPDQEPIGIVTLLQGQSATVSVSSFSGFGIKTVFVTSVGNKTLSASINPPGITPNSSLGWWVVTALGTGGRNFGDFSLGLVPWSGPAAAIDIGSGVSFAVVTSFVFLTTPGNASYSLRISQ